MSTGPFVIWTRLDLQPFVALAFREWLGGEKAINDYCHNLALDGGERLARILGTRVLDETGELTLNMVRRHPRLLTVIVLLIQRAV